MSETFQTPEEFFAALDSASESHPNDALVPHGQRACPICQNAMVTDSRFGMAIDVCPAHGTWLDHGEMEAMIAMTRRASPSVRRTALEQARREGKLHGALLGWWSLLME